MPFDLPDGWCWCKVEDTCCIFGRIGFRGYTKADLVSKNGAITLSPSNIVNGHMNYSSITLISWDKYEESPEIMVNNGDVLLVKTGSSYGKCALVEGLPSKATINPQLVVLRRIFICAEYLTILLQSSYARKCYEDFVLGTAIPTFTQAALGNIDFPLPPVKEQQRIVNEVKRLLEVIDRLETGQKNIESTIQTAKSKILDLAISGKLVPQDPADEPAIELLKRINPAFKPCDNPHYPFEVPSSWVFASGKDIFQSMKSAKPTGEEFCYIDIDSVDNKSNIITSPKIVKTENAPSRASRYTKSGDVIFSMVRPYLRNIAMVQYDNCIASTGFYVCSPTQSLCSDYLFLMMLSDYVVDGLNQYMKGDNSPSINTDNILSWKYPVPPLNEQKRIVAEVQRLYMYLNEVESCIIS